MQQNSFLDTLFPVEISAGAIGGPEFFTNITSSKGRGEFRNANWDNPKRKYIVSYKQQSLEEIQKLISFFNVCQGRRNAFRYKDWSDYKATNTHIAVADGKQKDFQLVKQYKFQNISYTRLITKPAPSTVAIFVNEQKVQDQMVDIDYLNGVAKFINPPKENDKISATFEFHVPTRFDVDFLPIEIIAPNRHNVENLILKEVNL